MKSLNDKPYLYLPIETKNREFHAKLLLACHAAKQGFMVMLGGIHELQSLSPSLPRGIIVDKSISFSKTNYFQKYKALGYSVTAWCEEGLVILDPEEYRNLRISEESFGLVDIFFAWGQNQLDALPVTFNKSGKVVLAGNPRFDLLRHPYREVFRQEAMQIKKQYGPFILINTNFGLFNHFNGRDFVLKSMRKRGRMRTDSDTNFIFRWISYTGDKFHRFLGVIPDLCKAFPHHTVIIRPHPSENHEIWEQKTREFENVKVVHKGNVIPWIMASDVVIHNSCTTGVEAYILRKPVIAYCPIQSTIFDSRLPNSVSLQAGNPEELFAVIQKVLADPEAMVARLQGDVEISRLASHFIQNAQGPFSTQLVVAALSELAVRKKIQNDFSVVRQHLARMVSVAASFGRRLLRKASYNAYNRQKFAGITLEEVEQTLQAFQKNDADCREVFVSPVKGAKHSFWISSGECCRQSKNVPFLVK